MEALLARAVQLLAALGGAYLLTLWFALVVWTFQDIQRRSRSVVAQIFSTLVVVLFFVPGILIYLLLRPRDTLDETFQRSLEEEYLLQDLEELALCPNCQRFVEADFVYCPVCRTELRQPCPTCDRLIDLRWEICPYCGADQYAEEEEADEAGRWAQREPATVSRFVQQARERIATRWTRLPADEDGATERSGSVAARDGAGISAPWEEGEASKGWSRANTRHLPADGNGASPFAGSWEPTDGGDTGDNPMDRTEELPAGTLRPKP